MPPTFVTRFLQLWFLINVLLALAPPLHWVFSAEHQDVFGLPPALVYFLGLALSITLNILTAYWDEQARGEFES